MTETSAQTRRTERGSKVLVLALVGIFVFAMLGFALAVIDAEPLPTAVPGPSMPELNGQAGSAPRILLAQAEVDSEAASPSPEPSASPLVEVAPSSPPVVPVVPVSGFWSKRDGLSRAAIVRALESGRSKGFRRVVVEDAVADPLAAALGIEVNGDVARLRPDRLRRAVARGALGLVAATSTAPSMRTLEVDKRSLIGLDRVTDLDEWPLMVTLGEAPSDAWDPADTWVLVAGGDSFTDRGVYQTVVQEGKGVDYPFEGGTARVTGHGCCDPVYHDNIVPRYVLTGNKGAVRKLFRRADLAIANHEQPVTDAWVHHGSGTRFSGKPALTRIFARAGIDFLSLANNHIGDYGAEGIRDTRRVLRQHGLAFGGAGKDLDQARAVSLLEAAGTKVAIVPCLDFVPIYWASDGRAGATPCVDQYIRKDIRKAHRAGADVVIVFPHWGVEYTRQPLPSMRTQAARWIDAGADLVIGAHSHVAGSIEDVEGVPVLYSLGNLIFDQHWSTNTMESALLEATFNGARLVELRLRPYIIHDTSQPNLLDPARGEGRRLLLSVKRASDAWLEW